jgi:hypothetical protein
MRFLHLAVLVLQNNRVSALQDTGRARRERRRVLAEAIAGAAGFDADQLDVLIARFGRARLSHC